MLTLYIDADACPVKDEVYHEGTWWLRVAAAEKGAAVVKTLEWTAAERRQRRRRAKRLGVIEPARRSYLQKRGWTDAVKALLGTAPDDEVAATIGRPENVVRVMLTKLGLLNPASPTWTAEELTLLETLPVAEVVRLTGRSCSAVYQMRLKLRQQRKGYAPTVREAIPV